MISVIMPVYNAEKYIKDAINSILSQTYKDFELLIVDDGSTDHTFDMIKTFDDPRIKVIQQRNSGPGAARNLAMSYAKGEYFAFCDADDTYEKNKLEIQKNTLDQKKDISVVWCNHYLTDENLNIIKEVTPEYVFKSRVDMRAYMLFRNIVTFPPTIMFRRCCYDNGCKYKEDIKHDEDYFLLLQLLEKYDFFHIPQPLCKYRRHNNNLTNDTSIVRKNETNIIKELGINQINHIVDESNFSNQEKFELKGKIFFKLSLYSEAQLFFNKLSIPQKRWIKYFYLGNIAYLNKNYQQAICNYKKSLESNPDSVETYNNLGCSYAVTNDNTAIIFFDKALKDLPTYMDATHNSICYNQKRNDYRITLHELRKNYKL